MVWCLGPWWLVLVKELEEGSCGCFCLKMKSCGGGRGEGEDSLYKGSRLTVFAETSEMLSGEAVFKIEQEIL